MRWNMNAAARAMKQLQQQARCFPVIPCSYARISASFLQSTSPSIYRLYSTEFQTQLSPDLVRIMEQRLSSIEHRSASLESFINRPEASPAEFSRANKELRKLRDHMDLIQDLRTKQKEISGLKSMLSECEEDKEMIDMTNEELSQALAEERRLQTLLLKLLLPKDDADERDCILEVRAGTGGEEASLFAMDIFRIFLNRF
ncbi:unnamed protein product [Linum tenue]|uniref:Peptide chain release factor domain-containing protein n=1 Tax=Linum tenue TaxID=586396 RepID=A0AAV0PH22_9ROSI|nr:unnamed protein product [Linum tenue]